MSMPTRLFRASIWVCVLALTVVLTARSGAPSPGAQDRTDVTASGARNFSNAAAGSSALKWIRTFGDFFSAKQPGYTEDSFCESALPTGDGGLVLAGEAELWQPWPGRSNVCDLILMEVRPTGKVDWISAYESSPQQWFTIPYNLGGLVQLGDGDYLLVARSSIHDPDTDTDDVHPILIKVGPDGQFRWARFIGIGPKGESPDDDEMSPAPTSDGGLILAGWSSSIGSWLVKLDSQGNISWGKKLSIGIGLGRPCGTSDGGFALLGYSSSRQTQVVKFDSRGAIQWHKNYAQGSDWGCGEVQTFASAICQTSDGGYFISGDTSGYDCNGDNRATDWLCQLDASGGIRWQKKAFAEHIFQSRDGGFVGSTEWGNVFKCGPTGSGQWVRLFRHTTIESALEAGGGDLVVTGHMLPEASEHFVMQVLYLNAAGTMSNPCALISSGRAVFGGSGLRVVSPTPLSASSYPVWMEPQPNHTVPRSCVVTTYCTSSLYRKPLK